MRISSLLPFLNKKSVYPLSHQTGQNTPKSNFFCQQNLRKIKNLLYNNVVLILLIMAGMRMTALAAGLGAALASGSEEANAQATEIRIPLETESAVGAEIVMDVRNVAYERQKAIMDHLGACIGEAELSRDECVAEAATLMAEERLQGVVRETHARLQPLEDSIGLTAAELIQEPVFCEYAPNTTEAEGCTDAIENVQLAAAQYQLASEQFRLIAAETRVADLDEAIESERDANSLRVARNAEIAAERDEETERADANAAVLAALRQVVAETNGTN